MIFFELMGGLGNQMFIYAFARSLSHDLNEKLMLDISYFNFKRDFEHAIYGLHPYNIKAIVGNYSIADYEKSSHLYQGDLNYYPWGVPLTKNSCYYDGFNEEVKKNIELPAFFTGYYSAGIDQDNKKIITEKFFSHNEDIIREDLKFSMPIDNRYVDIIKDMQESNSIAIHIRRGDYVSYFHRFGMCSLEYYDKAIEEIVSKVENPKFFVFSDDPEWVKNNLIINYSHTYVIYEDNADSSYGSAELLAIMSNCKHFIIANSTFSWWGSWLGDYEEKIIIAPEPWYQSRELLYADSISNKKPILIENNYSQKFYESNTVLFNFNDLKNSINLNESAEVIDNSVREIILPDIQKRDENNNAMIKFSLKTNAYSKLSIYYMTDSEKYYNERKCINVFYYENDEFDHYVFLPEDALLNNIKVVLGTYRADYLLKDFEIREIQKIEYEEQETENPIIENKPKKIISKTDSTIYKDIISKKVDPKLIKYYLTRVDIKNDGTENNTVKITKRDINSRYDYAPWFKNEKGQGLISFNYTGHSKFSFKCVGDGLLKINFRGQDVRNDEGKRLLVYVNFTKININGTDLIDKNLLISHDEPFLFKKKVLDNEEVTIDISWELF